MKYCFFSILLFLSFANKAYGQTSKIKLSVYFDTDKYSLKPDATHNLDLLWDSVGNDSIVQIYIVGNTDNRADSLYNIELSKNRCQAVGEYFVAKNLSPKLFKFNFYGEDKPITSNNSEEGKQRNRRVDIRISYLSKTTTAPVRDSLPKDPCKGIDTTIVLDNGTQLIFNRCEYNSIKECLQITSIRTTEELIQNNINLQTVDGISLITCGMVSICISPECKIKKPCFDQPIKVRFPYPGDKDSCLPCNRKVAAVFIRNAKGQWLGANRKDEKIEIVKSGGLTYYQYEFKCPKCGEYKNCDCKSCDATIKSERKKCPKVKIKLPRNYKLISAQIFVECPATILEFRPDTTRLISRNNIGKTRSRCFNGTKTIRVFALNEKGENISVQLQPLENIKHRSAFSRCKREEKRNQKEFASYVLKKNPLYRKYIVSKPNFSN